MKDWIVAILTLAASAFFIIINLQIFYNNWIARKKFVSWPPIIGGLCGAIGLTILPVEGARQWWWVPLFLDLGCIPGLVHTVWFYITRKNE